MKLLRKTSTCVVRKVEKCLFKVQIRFILSGLTSRKANRYVGEFVVYANTGPYVVILHRPNGINIWRRLSIVQRDIL